MTNRDVARWAERVLGGRWIVRMEPRGRGWEAWAQKWDYYEPYRFVSAGVHDAHWSAARQRTEAAKALERKLLAEVLWGKVPPAEFTAQLLSRTDMELVRQEVEQERALRALARHR